MKLHLRGVCVVAFWLVPAMVAAQATCIKNENQAPGITIQLNPGVVVEKVAKGSEGERAGLKEGDVVLSWSRGDLKGSVDSPFDLSPAEIEQAARGPVLLTGTRGVEKKSWTLGANAWTVQTRPNFIGSTLAAYLSGQELNQPGTAKAAAERWRPFVDQTKDCQPEWVHIWLLARTASVLAADRLWKEADEA